MSTAAGRASRRQQQPHVWVLVDGAAPVKQIVGEFEQSLPRGVGALELLQMVYRGEVKVSSQQIRAAIEAMPYELPNSAVAVGCMTTKTSLFA